MKSGIELMMLLVVVLEIYGLLKAMGNCQFAFN